MTAKSGKSPRQTSAKVNVAVVGLGFMGVTHLRAYLALPSARLVAVCGASRLPVRGLVQGVAGNIKKSDAVKLSPRIKVFQKLEELLTDPEVDLVDLCTPTPLHAEQAIAALQAGKHVLCEKPLARTAAAARKILHVAGSSPGFLMPAMCMRFWPGWGWLQQKVRQRAYGKMLAARFCRVSERPAWSRPGASSGGTDLGGALFDFHIHDTDYALFLCGPPQAVFSTGVTDAAGSIDQVVTQYIYPGGPAVHAEASWLQAAGFNMSFTIHCERATLDFDYTHGADALQITEPGKRARPLHFEEPDGYGPEIRYFVDCVAGRRPPSIVTARDAVTTLEICEAEEKSLRTGTVVRISHP